MRFLFAILNAGSVPGSGGGPSAAPAGLAKSAYGSPSKHRLSWTNGDASAYTDVIIGSTLLATVLPGVSSYDTLYTIVAGYSSNTFVVRHRKNGALSGSSTLFATDVGPI